LPPEPSKVFVFYQRNRYFLGRNSFGRAGASPNSALLLGVCAPL
jgi:hypothetical protein